MRLYRYIYISINAGVLALSLGMAGILYAENDYDDQAPDKDYVWVDADELETQADPPVGATRRSSSRIPGGAVIRSRVTTATACQRRACCWAGPPWMIRLASSEAAWMLPSSASSRSVILV